jgi:hypothetical protein
VQPGCLEKHGERGDRSPSGVLQFYFTCYSLSWAELGAQLGEQILSGTVRLLISFAADLVSHDVQLYGPAALHADRGNAVKARGDSQQAVEGDCGHRALYGPQHLAKQFQLGGDDALPEPDHKVKINHAHYDLILILTDGHFLPKL